MDWQWNGGYTLRSSSDTGGDVQRVLTKLESTGQDQVILRLVANSPNVFRPFVLLANSLVNKAALPDADREALVLHLATKEGAPYEWAAHLAPAEDAGLTGEQIDSLGDGSALSRTDLFSDSQFLALRLGDRLADGHSFTPDEWTEAIATWGTEGALDLVFSVSWWAGFVKTFTTALDLRPA